MFISQFKDLADLILQTDKLQIGDSQKSNSDPTMHAKENHFKTHDTALKDYPIEPLQQSKDQMKIQIVYQNISRLQSSKSQAYQNLSELALQYKLSLQYSSALGIYVLPQDGDFFSKFLFMSAWQIYLFLRQGYYKDSKIKGLIIFDKIKQKKIQTIRFLSPVFHPLVNFDTGQVDLNKLFGFKNTQCNQQIITQLMLLKQMFTNQHYFMVKDSFNLQASKIYQKSQMLFIQKVFQTTVIPSEQFIFGDTARDQIDLETDLQNWNEEQKIMVKMKEQLKIVCPNSVKCLTQISKEPSNKQQESIESKVQKYMKMLMDQDGI